MILLMSVPVFLGMEGSNSVPATLPSTHAPSVFHAEPSQDEPAPTRTRTTAQAASEGQSWTDIFAPDLIIYAGLSTAPGLIFEKSGFGNQAQVAFDVLGSLFIKDPFTLHMQFGFGYMSRDWSDMELYLPKAGIGITAAGGPLHISGSVGGIGFLAGDFDKGSPVAFMVEGRVGFRGVFVPNLILSLGYLWVPSVSAQFKNQSVDSITGFFLSFGVGR